MHVLDAVGNTSIVRLRKVVPKGSADVLVKLEGENPTGSMKDRMALAVLSPRRGGWALRPGGTVVTLACDSGLKYLSTDVYRRA